MMSMRKLACAVVAAMGMCCGAAQGQVVISQVYGAGGNASATYNQDFIELFNRGTAAVVMTNWSVQYQTQAASTWTVVAAISATIQPGRYFLVSSGTAGANGVALPTPDLVGGSSITLSATQGKIVLVDTATVLPTGCPTSGVQDLVAFGITTVICREGTANASTTGSTNTQSVQRLQSGCQDAGQNGSDFTLAAVTPRNANSPTFSCSSTVSGACCDNLGVCTIGLQTACSAPSTFQGPDTTCEPPPCTATASACCTNQAACSITTLAGCTGSATFVLPLGTTCAAANCASLVGACCNAADGLCAVNYPSSCPSGFTFTTTGTSCTVNPCPQPSGACCTGNTAGSACTVGLASDCTPAQFLGANSACGAGNANCAPPGVVISQLYGGGGGSNAGQTYKTDYIEIFNRSASSVDIGGWTLQYASSAGVSWSRCTALPSVSIPAGRYYLIKFTGGTGGADLTGEDYIPINGLSMANDNGKVALLRSSLLLANPTACPVGGAGVADFVGYGSADCREGAAAAGTLGISAAAVRNVGGCADTNNNGADITVVTNATPRNSSSPLNDCFSQPPSLTVSISPGAVCNESSGTITAVVTPGIGPASTTITVTADLQAIGGPMTSAPFTLSGMNTFTLSISPAAMTTAGLKSIPVTVTDQVPRSASANVSVIVSPCGSPISDIVISQLYGGGGNSGATYTHDFVELFNRTGAAVDISGWSLQYASSLDTGSSGAFGSGITIGTSVNNVVTFAPNTIIPPGKYFLIQLQSSAAVGAAIPTPDLSTTTSLALGISSTGGRLVLVRNSTAPLNDGAMPPASLCSSPLIADLVGYGSLASCYEGNAAVGPTQDLSNTTSALRRLDGCQDTDNNRIDFVVGASVPPRNSATPANNCVPVIPTGACCNSGTCTPAQTMAACTGGGGTYQGDTSACSPSSCPAIGTCCTTGVCSLVYTAPGQVACVDGGGTNNAATTCSPDPCVLPPSGVCCRGSTCIVDAGLQSQAACAASITGGALAGATFVAAGPCGANPLVPCCYADYNQNGTRNVTDIFNFLTDWFAARPWAIPGGNGTGTPAVGNIFAFLTAWFAGGCAPIP